MTRIDFYTNISDKLSYACRVVRKAYGARSKVVVLVQDAQQAQAFDTALWTFSATEFIPHGLADDALAPHTPVLITTDDSADLPHHEMLVNLTQRMPSDIARFSRIFEFVTTDANEIASGRQRYAAYKKQSFTPIHHDIKQP